MPTLMQWRPIRHRRRCPNSKLQSWLAESHSLTRRLQRHCPQCFNLRVLSQCWQIPTADEARCLGLAPRHYARIRQICMSCNGHDWVFARTVFPHTTLTGSFRQLRYLGAQSLGSILFARTLKRTPLEFVELAATHPFYQLIKQQLNLSTPPSYTLWGRRSIFYLSANRPLLVMEFFLPALLS